MKILAYLTLLAGIIGLAGPIHGADLSFGSRVPGLTTESDEILPVERAFVLTVGGDQDRIQLDWAVTPGYFLYRHMFEVRVDGQAVALQGLPHGEPKHDEYFGDVEVFHQDVGFDIPRAELGGELTIEVRYQGCADAGFCYPPQKVRLNVAKM